MESIVNLNIDFLNSILTHLKLKTKNRHFEIFNIFFDNKKMKIGLTLLFDNVPFKEFPKIKPILLYEMIKIICIVLKNYIDNDYNHFLELSLAEVQNNEMNESTYIKFCNSLKNNRDMINNLSIYEQIYFASTISDNKKNIQFCLIK